MTARPRVGFLGVGWIGRHRMEAMLATGLVEAAAIADPSPEMATEAARLAPDAAIVGGLRELLDLGLDGIVIATPSALHAEQSIACLERGTAVFCQKPLGRTADEAAAVVAAARSADRLLEVDLSYRFTDGMGRVRELLRSGELGRIYAADLVFHNAYGPDKPWFYDRKLAGGGCLMDLGVHLVDLLLWALDFPDIANVRGRTFHQGAPLLPGSDQVEDYAVGTLALEDGATAQLACSWRLHAGREAIISATFYGTDGGVSFRNVGGSFYDFAAERFRGTETELLTDAPEQWGGRAAAQWATRLANGDRFCGEAERLVDAARIIDRLYAAPPLAG